MKDELAAYIKDRALLRGDFTLSSGQKSTYYIDLRRVSMDWRVAPIIGRVMLELLADLEDIYAVGGLTLGADSIAASIMYASLNTARPCSMFVVRKAPKVHGGVRLIEGPELSGRRVVVVEDVSTTGNSPLKAVRSVRAAGGEVAAVAVLVDRGAQSRRLLESEGLSYRAALGPEDLGL